MFWQPASGRKQLRLLSEFIADWSTLFLLSVVATPEEKWKKQAR